MAIARMFETHPIVASRLTNTQSGPIVSLISLIFLAGGIVLSLFVILSGVVESNPVNRVYFLQAGTSGISGARNPSRWTYFALCGAAGSRNANCGRPVPAFMFDPANKDNFGTTAGVPAAFLGYVRRSFHSQTTC